MHLFGILAKIIAEVIGIKIEDVYLNDSFSDLGADSIHVTEILMRTEDLFHIDISDEDGNKIKTIIDLIEYVNQHKIMMPLGSIE